MSNTYPWEQYPLHELEERGIATLGRGNIISKKDILGNPGAYPIYSSSARGEGLFGSYGDYMFDEEMITWSVDGGGNLFYRPKHKFSVTNVSGFMRLDTSVLDYRFAHAALALQHSRLTFDYQTKAHPSMIRNLYHLPIPPLPEQKKIAEILSSVSSLHLAHSKELERICLLKKAFETYLLHGSSESAMGIKTMQSDASRIRLEEVASFSQGVQVGVENHFSRMEAGMTRFLRISDYTKDDEPPRYIDSSFAIKGIVSEDDIVMIRYGEAGRVCRGMQGAIANNLFTITPESGISKEYLFMYLSSSLVQDQLKAMSTSTAMPAINFKRLGQIEIKPIDADAQDAVCARLRAVNQNLDFLNKKIKHLERLTQAISNDLLSGRKRVTL